jgi:hypothetical protein
MPGVAIRGDEGRFNTWKIPAFIRVSFGVSVRIIVNLK